MALDKHNNSSSRLYWQRWEGCLSYFLKVDSGDTSVTVANTGGYGLLSIGEIGASFDKAPAKLNITRKLKGKSF